MDCFLGCFGFKDCSWSKSLPFSRFFLWKKREPPVPKNQYSSLVSSKEKATPSKKEGEEIFQEKFDGDDCVHQEQRKEAKLRRTCGAILYNIDEFLQASDEHYVVSDASIKNWNKKHDESSHPLSKVPETSTISEEKSKSLFSCQLEYHEDKSRKTLLFEEVKHPRVEKELESITLDMSPQIENKMQDSPYPTPLNLVDGMQTPGTIYPPKSDYFRARMLRAQFVYPIPDLFESTFGLKVASEDSENTVKMYDSPTVDRPIIGAIAAPWDEDLLSFLSPKSCEGNEIPNSTANYSKET
ncbi:hypothetical protein KFK09_011225 [Dendrobium nobile]|uniref:Uncharacterized protein n=1 Tax=Dendrobium nobile TaxID=94219 RepID=A0A8T3BEB2_DENNO|nr:hypothetical protein KFK09_011225 [Dendrobium nobile]